MRDIIHCAHYQTASLSPRSISWVAGQQVVKFPGDIAVGRAPSVKSCPFTECTTPKCSKTDIAIASPDGAHWFIALSTIISSSNV